MSTPARQEVRVALGARSYDIVIGDGLLAEAGARAGPLLPRGRAVVVADATADRLHGSALARGLADAGIAADVIAIEPGEARKGFADLEALCEALLARELERDEAILAFGGGVIGDLAGFAAAIVKRGLPFIQVPTTLLAQVDSSVGGKTAINTRAGKNLVGAFHQPSLVLADTATLDTLPVRELRAGFAEIVKAAVIDGEAFLSWLESATETFFAGDPAVRAEAIGRAAAFKADIVAKDERESGPRALLNLGHTFGHALEAEAGYGGALLHGEAVAIGCALAAEYAAETGRAPAALAVRIEEILARAGLPSAPRAVAGVRLDPAALVRRMRSDKKNKAGRIRLVLPAAPGRCEVVDEERPERLLAFLEERAA